VQGQAFAENGSVHGIGGHTSEIHPQRRRIDIEASRDKQVPFNTMTNPDPHPVELQKVDETSLKIIWSDGVSTGITWKALREKCPCAACREESNKPLDPFRVLKPAELLPLKPVRFTPTGNYAYKVDWSDGHASGIYSIKYLREICTQP